MYLSTIKTFKDIETCVDMYLKLSDDAFIPASREAAVRSLWEVVRQKKFVHCVRDSDDRIRAWLYADRVKHQHMLEPVFQQVYYASDHTGVKAVRCVQLLHDLMCEAAGEAGYKFCLSAGSHMDSANTFARILERCGWQRRGYLAVRRLVPEPPRRPQAGPR